MNQRRLLPSISPLVIFMVVSLGLTWPLPLSVTSAVPLGTEFYPTVPLLNVWTVNWNANRAGHGLRDYWQAPIFHPVTDAFVYSEAQPTTLLVAPLVKLGTPALAYNVYLWGVLTLNGWSAFRLLRCWGLAGIAAGLGGVMMQSLPYVHQQLGVLQLTTIFGFIWTSHALTLFFTGSSWRAGVRLGAAVCVTYWACNYHGYYLSIIAPLTFLCLWSVALIRRCRAATNSEVATTVDQVATPTPTAAAETEIFELDPTNSAPDGTFHLKSVSGEGANCQQLSQPVTAFEAAQQMLAGMSRWQRFRWLLVGAGVAVAIVAAGCGPILWQQRVSFESRNLSRTLESLIPLSAHPIDFIREERPLIQSFNRFIPATLRASAWPMSPGWARWVLALLGMAAALCGRRGVTLWLMLVVVSLTAFWIALGPGRSIAGFSAYAWLFEHWPGCDRLRNPFRWGVVVQIAATLLAARGLAVLLPHGPLRWQSWRTVVGVVLGCVACLSGRYWPNKLQPLPPVPAWVSFVIDNTQPTDLLADLPFPQGINIDTYEATTWAMYWQFWHQRPLVNGYSGYYPETFLSLKSQLALPQTQVTASSETDAASAASVPTSTVTVTIEHLAALREAGVRWCIFPSKPVPALKGLSVAFEDPVTGTIVSEIETD